MKKLHIILIMTLLLGPQLFSQTGGQPVEPVIHVVPIHGDIEPSMAVFVKSGIDKALEAGATHIIIDINTFGGRVDSALQIAAKIGSVSSAKTIAFVPASPEGMGVSWSAGALISMSCSAIYMAPGTSIGAAAPIYQSSEGMVMAEEKTVSAVRTQMASLAEKNGYPPAVAVAMVDKDIELLEVVVDGKPKLIYSEEADREKSMAEEAGVTFETGRIISPEGKLLTLTAAQMEEFGLSQKTVPAIADLIVNEDGTPGTEIYAERTLADRIVAALTGAVISGLLVTVGLLALYMEITSPGFGIPGTVAIICFATVYLGGAVLGTLSSLEIILLLIGIALIVVELFIIPGFGVTGISGIICILASLVLSRQTFIIPETPWEWDLLGENFLFAFLSLIGAAFLAAVLMPILPKTKMFKKLILAGTEGTESGYTVQIQQSPLLGQTGTTLTVLRPSGKARFGEEILVVETDGDFIQKGSNVRIIEVNGNRVKVTGDLS